jgi:hypothetical protein
MKMKKILFILFLGGLTTLYASAPFVTLVVGEAFYLNSSKRWKVLSVSQEIQSDSVIRVMAKSQVTITSNGTVVTISGPVIIKTGDILKSFSNSSDDSDFRNLLKKITGNVSRVKSTTVVAVRGDKKYSRGNPQWADPLESDNSHECFVRVPDLIDKGNLKKAALLLQENQDGCSSYFHYFTGIILFQEGRFKESSIHLIKAYKSGRLKSEHFEKALLQHSLACYYNGRYSLAASILERNKDQFSTGETDIYKLLVLYYSAAHNKSKARYYQNLSQRD